MWPWLSHSILVHCFLWKIIEIEVYSYSSFEIANSRAKSIFSKTLNFQICELTPEATFRLKSCILDFVLLVSKEMSHNIWYTCSQIRFPSNGWESMLLKKNKNKKTLSQDSLKSSTIIFFELILYKKAHSFKINLFQRIMLLKGLLVNDDKGKYAQWK